MLIDEMLTTNSITKVRATPQSQESRLIKKCHSRTLLAKVILFLDSSGGWKECHVAGLADVIK